MRHAARAVILISAGLLLASCQGVLDPQGPIAAAERLLLINSTAIMLVVVIPVIVATLAFAWWYRAANTRATRSLDECRMPVFCWTALATNLMIVAAFPILTATFMMVRGSKRPRDVQQKSACPFVPFHIWRSE